MIYLLGNVCAIILIGFNMYSCYIQGFKEAVIINGIFILINLAWCLFVIIYEFKER